MAAKSYYEKLRDPRWQKLRLQVMDRDGFTCRVCLDNESTLNVHHRLYIKGRDPWDYPMEGLVTLCEDCHKREANVSEVLHSVIMSLFPFDFGDAGRLEEMACQLNAAWPGGVRSDCEQFHLLHDAICMVVRMARDNDPTVKALAMQFRNTVPVDYNLFAKD